VVGDNTYVEGAVPGGGKQFCDCRLEAAWTFAHWLSVIRRPPGVARAGRSRAPSPPPETELPELDAAIAAAERILNVARECGSADCVEANADDVRRHPARRSAAAVHLRLRAARGNRRALPKTSDDDFKLNQRETNTCVI
jgi:hypothetical protein